MKNNCHIANTSDGVGSKKIQKLMLDALIRGVKLKRPKAIEIWEDYFGDVKVSKRVLSNAPDLRNAIATKIYEEAFRILSLDEIFQKIKVPRDYVARELEISERELRDWNKRKEIVGSSQNGSRLDLRDIQKAYLISQAKSYGFTPDQAATVAEEILQVGQIEHPLSDEEMLNTIRINWKEFVEEVKRRKISTGTFLAEGWPKSLSYNQLIVGFMPNKIFHFKQIIRSWNFIEEVAKDFFGYRLRMFYTLNPEPQKPLILEELDERVQMVLQVFSGPVVQ